MAALPQAKSTFACQGLRFLPISLVSTWPVEMPLRPFDASRLKIRRARTHIGDLQGRVSAYLLRKPIYLRIDHDLGFAHGKKWTVHVREGVPIDLAPIIGDAIHNLRSALDLLACELVRANGQSDARVEFPFAETEAGLHVKIKRRHMDRASAAVQAKILAWAPHKGAAGNSLLCAIQDLDIMDKHQALIPVMSSVGVAPIIGLPNVKTPPRWPQHHLAAFWVADDHLHLPIGFIAEAEFGLQFEPFRATARGLVPAPLAGQEVIPALIAIAKEVETLVEEFARLP